MMFAILFLSLFLLVNNALLAVLWRQNQNLHEKLLRVTAKSAVPHAVVQEVAPSHRHKSDERLAYEKQQAEAQRALWRR